MSLAEPHPQNDFINAARKERRRVEIYLVNGIRLAGYIESFDQYLVMLRTPAGLQGIYKRAISTIQLDTGTRSGSKSHPNRSPHGEPGHEPQRRGPYSHGTREFRESRESKESRESRESGEPGAGEAREPYGDEPSSYASYSQSSPASDPFLSAPAPERPSASRPVIITRRRRVWSRTNIKDNGSDER